MSLKYLIRAGKCGSTLHHITKQIHLRSASSICSGTSLLAQSTKILSSINYSTAAKTNATQTDTINWITIYSLPMARLVASFQRLKIYQGAITAVALPISCALSQFDLLSTSAVIVVGAIGGTGLITLSFFSLIARNVVGFIYINEECDKLKLAYVDYWGKRCHAIVDIDDLDIDLQKSGPTAFNRYRKICLYSDKKPLFKLLLDYGVIVEPDTFAGIFGE